MTSTLVLPSRISALSLTLFFSFSIRSLTFWSLLITYSVIPRSSQMVACVRWLTSEVRRSFNTQKHKYRNLAQLNNAFLQHCLSINANTTQYNKQCETLIESSTFNDKLFHLSFPWDSIQTFQSIAFTNFQMFELLLLITNFVLILIIWWTFGKNMQIDEKNYRFCCYSKINTNYADK